MGIIGIIAALCLAAGAGACTLSTKGHLSMDGGRDDFPVDDWIYEAASEDGPGDGTDGSEDEGPDPGEEMAEDMDIRMDLDAAGETPRDFIPEDQTDLPDAEEEEPSIECGGVVVGGFCWYVSDKNRNCTDKCALHGGCNLAGTRDYAGSGGTDAQCLEVLGALGYGGYNHQSFGNNALGCHVAWGNWTYWSTLYETTCEAAPSSSDPDPFAYRMCACER
jgi:hypothetical protein